MVTKAEFIKALQELPEDATIDDAVERLAFMIAVQHGLAQADAGELIPHEEIVQLVKTWLKQSGRPMPATTLRPSTVT